MPSSGTGEKETGLGVGVLGGVGVNVGIGVSVGRGVKVGVDVWGGVKVGEEVGTGGSVGRLVGDTVTSAACGAAVMIHRLTKVTSARIMIRVSPSNKWPREFRMSSVSLSSGPTRV